MPRHIYIHIPFCEAKCPYCDFFSVPSAELVEGYFDAASKEMDHALPLPSAEMPYPGERDTLYIGGGTPSVPDASYIASLVNKARSVFELSSDAEITIEVNPHSVTHGKMLVYRDCGINRISVGVQSLQDDVLKTLGRLHDREGALRAVSDAISVFENVSCDLMLGIPGQSLQMLLSDAAELAGLGVKHISMYSLTLAEGTPFYSRYGNILEDLVPDEREMYHGLRDHLASLGIMPYEISNCAVPGYESRHNMCYWQGREYYAIGPSAHGFIGGRRFSHPSSVASYIEDPCHTDTEEVLSSEERMREYAMLMLRTSGGVDRGLFQRLYGKPLDEVYETSIRENISKGYLQDTGDAVRLTDRGLDFANLVFADFL